MVSLCRLKHYWSVRVGCGVWGLWPFGIVGRMLLKMDVLTFETFCAVNSEIMKQVASSWSIFTQQKSTCFEQFLCPSSGVFHCSHSNGICHTVLLTACEQDQYGWRNSP